MAKITNDVSAYQDANLAYFKKLKKLGSKGVTVKLTEGTEYLNLSAKYQIYNALRVFGNVSTYHFLDGNESATSQARYFKNWMKSFHLDSSTIWALDVEAYNLPWYCNHMINLFISYMKSHGYPHGKVVYGSGSWFNKKRINKKVINTNKFWVAAYDTSEPGVNGTSVWQYTDNFKGLDTDASLDFNNTFTHKSKSKKRRKTIVDPYWHDTGKYKVITSVNVYSDPKFKHNDGMNLDKGSTFRVTGVISIGKATRLKTDVGYISGNKDFVRPIK